MSSEFNTSLGNMARLCLEKQGTNEPSVYMYIVCHNTTTYKEGVVLSFIIIKHFICRTVLATCMTATQTCLVPTEARGESLEQESEVVLSYHVDAGD